MGEQGVRKERRILAGPSRGQGKIQEGEDAEHQHQLCCGEVELGGGKREVKQWEEPRQHSESMAAEKLNREGLWGTAELRHGLSGTEGGRAAGIPFISYLTKVRRNRDPRTP